MTILCIETSTSICSAAIYKDGMPAEQCICLEGSNHARLLPRYIEHLLQWAKEKVWTIDAVAVSEGPGSYTGLRIGTSLAKGICYGLNIPLIPIDTLQVLCASTAMHTIPEGALLCPMLDARRMEVYTALYELESNKLQVVSAVESKIIDEQSFADELAKQPIYFFGNGAAKCREFITHPNAHFIDNIVPQAQYMGQLAEMQSNIQDVKQMAYYEPFYLKEFVAAPSHVKGLK